MQKFSPDSVKGFIPDPAHLKPMFYSIPSISSSWSNDDLWGAIKVRLGIKRDQYRVTPGLYRLGNPDSKADVFVSANYKLSFDLLRKNLSSLNAWILVIDTNGINVWCAAGKKTFGTSNIIRSIQSTSLENSVSHRKLIVPQLGAPGVAAHRVKEETGFSIIYGPVRAADIKSFILNEYKADADMRKVTFSLSERAKLIPVDFLQNFTRLLLVLLIAFVLAGLDKAGFLFKKMAETGYYPVATIASGYFGGIAITPLLLPYLPFRSFSLKGASIGFLSACMMAFCFTASWLEIMAVSAVSISTASFVAMNFTGSSTYTSLSGVKKEMKYALPVQIALVVSGCLLFIISKLIN